MPTLFSIQNEKGKAVIRQTNITRATEHCIFYDAGWGDTEHPLQRTQLYTCKDINTIPMYGTDRGELISAWNAAVKAHVKAMLSIYENLLMDAGNKDAAQQKAKPAEPAPRPEVNPEPKPVPAPAEAPAAPATVETAVPAAEQAREEAAPLLNCSSDFEDDAETAAPQAPVKEPVSAEEPQQGKTPPAPAEPFKSKYGASDAYPRACSLRWADLNKQLAVWRDILFGKDSAVKIEAQRELYNTGDTSGWTVELTGLRQENKETVTRMLRRYDKGREVSLEQDWDDTAETVSLSLGNAIAVQIMDRIVLPHLPNPFPFGIDKTLASDVSVLFISGPVDVTTMKCDDTNPRVIEYSWKELQQRLSIWMANRLPEDSTLLAAANVTPPVAPNGRSGWSILFMGVTDTPSNKAALHDIFKTYSQCSDEAFEQIWAEALELGSLELPQKMSELILMREVMMKEDPVFPFKIGLSLVADDGITFISQILQK